MAKTNQDFTTYIGNDAQITFTVTDAAGVALNLTGVVEITWKASLFDFLPAVIEKTKTAAEITVTAPATGGIFVVTLVPADTSALAPGDYYHEALIKDSTNKVTTVAIGTMRLRASLAI